MRNFMRHYTRYLGFVVRSIDQPGVDENRSSRKCERIDRRVIDQGEGVRITLRFRLTGEAFQP